MTTPAGVLANGLLTDLTTGVSFTIPSVNLDDTRFNLLLDAATSPLYQHIIQLTPADITTGSVSGTGAFDVIMAGVSAQLEREFTKGRITGAEYTKAFIATTEAALQSAVQFALGKDQVYWQSQQAQIAAITAMVGLAAAKVSLAKIQYEALTAQTVYAGQKLKLATENITFDTAAFNLQYILPGQSDMLVGQVAQINAQTSQTGAQTELIQHQKTLLDTQIQSAQYTYSYILPIQKDTAFEQWQVQRAQTQEQRSEDIPVMGIIGMQKNLYAQQIVSYKRDSEVKAGKLFTDAWVTQKTLDDGLTPPNGFTNASVDEVLSTIMANNNFGS